MSFPTEKMRRFRAAYFALCREHGCYVMSVGEQVEITEGDPKDTDFWGLGAADWFDREGARDAGLVDHRR